MSFISEPMQARRVPFRHARRGDASRLPVIGQLVGWFSRVAAKRWGRVPIGLVALLPIALLIDLFDAADELVLGPVGMGVAFALESAFLLAVTGSAAPAFGLAALDLIPLVDTIPWATIMLAVRIWREWGEAPASRGPDGGRVIDV